MTAVAPVDFLNTAVNPSLTITANALRVAGRTAAVLAREPA